MTAVALQHRDQIIQRVANGEYLQSIAQSLGLKGKGQSISDYLANDPEYQAAREQGLEAKLARREAEMEGADKDDVPRARELLSHARWRAERECPQRWGQKQHLTVEREIPGKDREILADASELLKLVRKRGLPATNAVQHGTQTRVIEAEGSQVTD